MTEENPNPELSLEEFREQCNNFPLYFVDDCKHWRREKEHFLRFQRENSDLEKELTMGITKIRRTPEYSRVFELFENELYKSYNIMRKYSPKNLFG
jgi:hypothetical protein